MKKTVPIGWTGFDGGLKPAISFVKSRRPEEDDPIPQQPADECLEDGTLLDVTLAGKTVCGCAVTGDGERYNVTDPADIDALLGVHEDIPLGTLTVIGSIEMQAYSDECVTPDGDPVMVDIAVLVTCADGFYSVTIQFDTPTSPSATAVVFFTDQNYVLDETMDNAQECIGSSTFNVPWVFGTVEVSEAA